MIGLLYNLLAILVIFAVYLIFQAIGGIAAGAKIEEINFFGGKALLSFKLGETTFRLNWFPNGSSVKFAEDFQHLHPLKKILTALFGLASYIVVAVVCLGAAEALHQICTGYGQLFRTAILPIETGSRLIGALVALFAEKPFHQGLGVTSAKAFALNSLPLGLLNGGFIILCLLEFAGFKLEKFRDKFGLFGLCIILLMGLSWAIAFAVFLSRIAR